MVGSEQVGRGEKASVWLVCNPCFAVGALEDRHILPSPLILL